MTRSSSAVLRAAAILDFIAEHPGQAFSMAELVRALKQSQSSCHSLLNALVQTGYLFRTTERTYVLGPGLASIGRLAAERYSPLQIAQPEMRRLADRLDVICSAAFREGDTTITRERATSAGKLGHALDYGKPVKLRAPVAVIYLAWSSEEAASWLADLPPDRAEMERDVLLAGMQFARTHGFTCLVRNRSSPTKNGPVETMFDGDVGELPFTIQLSIDPGETYDVSSIVAPVFNAAQAVEFAISIRGFDEPMPGEDVLRIAEELKAACMRISSFSGLQHAPTRTSSF